MPADIRAHMHTSVRLYTARVERERGREMRRRMRDRNRRARRRESRPRAVLGQDGGLLLGVLDGLRGAHEWGEDARQSEVDRCAA